GSVSGQSQAEVARSKAAGGLIAQFLSGMAADGSILHGCIGAFGRATRQCSVRKPKGRGLPKSDRLVGVPGKGGSVAADFSFNAIGHPCKFLDGWVPALSDAGNNFGRDHEFVTAHHFLLFREK